MLMRICFPGALLVAACVALCAADGPDGATLNLQVRTDTGVIHVSDIWKNAGPKASAVIGTAPPPGRSFMIESSQLAYIARLYDVNWKPVSGAERASVESGGRPLERDEVLGPVRRGLAASGVTDTMTIELANFTPVMVPPLAFPIVMVEGLSYDPAAERFSANLLVSSEGMEKQAMRVAGRVVQLGNAVVPIRRMMAEEVVAATDVKLVQLPERRLGGEIVRTTDLVVGQAMRRTVAAGQPIVTADIGQPMMITKGAQVVLIVDTPGLSIAAQGLAMSAGGRDETIQVMNPVSRAVVAARVTGPGRAVIVPGLALLVGPAARRSLSPEVAQ